jgi:hypothetical protein
LDFPTHYFQRHSALQLFLLLLNLLSLLITLLPSQLDGPAVYTQHHSALQQDFPVLLKHPRVAATILLLSDLFLEVAVLLRHFPAVLHHIALQRLVLPHLMAIVVLFKVLAVAERMILLLMAFPSAEHHEYHSVMPAELLRNHTCPNYHVIPRSRLCMAA